MRVRVDKKTFIHPFHYITLLYIITKLYILISSVPLFVKIYVYIQSIVLLYYLKKNIKLNLCLKIQVLILSLQSVRILEIAYNLQVTVTIDKILAYIPNES